MVFIEKYLKKSMQKRGLNGLVYKDSTKKLPEMSSNMENRWSKKDLLYMDTEKYFFEIIVFCKTRKNIRFSLKKCGIFANKLYFISIMNYYPEIKNSLPAIKNSFPAIKNSFYASKNSFPAIKNSFYASKNSFSAIKNSLPVSKNSFSAIKNSFYASKNSFSVKNYSLPESGNTFSAINKSLAGMKETFPAGKNEYPAKYHSGSYINHISKEIQFIIYYSVDRHPRCTSAEYHPVEIFPGAIIHKPVGDHKNAFNYGILEFPDYQGGIQNLHYGGSPVSEFQRHAA
jgi:hypothetical protein